jgi:predicted transglutaminase-like cysteine proteinase
MAHTRFCLQYPADCAAHSEQTQTGLITVSPERWEELNEVNHSINRAIAPERNTEGVAGERWLISPESGDCNDYAVTKRHELVNRGWPAQALLLAEVVTRWGEHHLVLVVRTEGADLVLDSLNSQIRTWSTTGYRWVRIQSPENPVYWASVTATPRHQLGSERTRVAAVRPSPAVTVKGDVAQTKVAQVDTAQVKTAKVIAKADLTKVPAVQAKSPDTVVASPVEVISAMQLVAAMQLIPSIQVVSAVEPDPAKPSTDSAEAVGESEPREAVSFWAWLLQSTTSRYVASSATA